MAQKKTTTTRATLTVAATGDSLMVAPFPAGYARDMALLRDYLSDADVRITNLETNVGAFGDFASAYSGGTWLNTEPEAFDSMAGFGFNYFGTANNHTMDYSYHALLSTMEALKSRGLAFSGTGRSLDEAGAPAVIETPAGRVGIIAATTTFENASRAGRASLGSAPRPGVNYVRRRRYYQLPADELETLRKLALKSGESAYRSLMIAQGFTKPGEKGVVEVGGALFCEEGTHPPSVCDERDLARIVESIRKAKKSCRYVFALLHCHEIDGTDPAEAPAFLRELAHGCIDAGASAVFGGGSHELRPVERYRGAPIFYSLGDFIYQGMRVKFLPADFMEKYGLPPNATAQEGLAARSHGGKIGLQAERRNFLTVLPKLSFRNGKLAALELLPVDLAFNRKDLRNGLPRKASDKTAREIFERLAAISASLGTRLILRDGRILFADQAK